MNEMTRQDEEVKKRQFLELYYQRKRSESPTSIMKTIGLPKRMLADWLQDQEFKSEIDTVDEVKLWASKEVIQRNMPAIVRNMITIATEGNNANAIKAADMLCKIVGLIGKQHGATTSIEINNTNVSGAVDGMTVEDLVEKRNAILRILGEPVEASVVEEPEREEAQARASRD